ncbi:dihydroxyacetone kinase subunit DhaL [Abyssisolibacter fermentans]|uniref:dihydroxyacetone kinase subunit DhaL n=1 Tax=Abyssisolibacter fermentans TaxID=1766203 RepID=UPI0008324EEF|nr:dihydroxyacetone kinase subunit DhaL [Abyssisolibacter fermentans]
MKKGLNTKDVVEVLKRIAKRIEENKDYITELDAILGDGDHWANMNMGYQKIVSIEDELLKLNLADLLKKIGMTLMSTIGGSSGVLYGVAFITAHKSLIDVDEIDELKIYEVLNSGLNAMMERGNAKPGDKTMIDTLYHGVKAYKESLDNKEKFETAINKMVKSAEEGMKSTKDMEAAKGRAFYRNDKGVGHIDPGAVTMYYQLEELAQYILM